MKKSIFYVVLNQMRLKAAFQPRRMGKCPKKTADSVRCNKTTYILNQNILRQVVPIAYLCLIIICYLKEKPWIP